MLNADQLTKLSQHALLARRDVLKMVHRAGSGHVGGSLGAMEIVVALCHHIMKHDPERPDWPERDRFVLSKGRCTPVLCGDGEQREGQIWEAGLFAHKYELDNLITFTDRNRLQTDGDTEQVMPLEPLVDKWRAFGWNSREIDGHDYDQIIGGVEDASNSSKRPTMIVANTIKGKGVSFMENEAIWHGAVPDDEQHHRAMEELNNATV